MKTTISILTLTVLVCVAISTLLAYALWNIGATPQHPQKKEAVTAPGPCAKDFVYDPGANTCAVSFVFQIDGAQNLQCVKVPAKPPAELGLQCSYTPSPTYLTKRGK